VQRGDAEMEQKLNRVIRACLERGNDNPICSIHDQGAGGNGKLRCSHTNKETTLNWVLFVHKHMHINVYHILIADKSSKKFMSLNFSGRFESFLQWEL